MGSVRRGRASDAIFSIATGARHHYRPKDQIGPKVRRVRVIDVYNLFTQTRALRLVQVDVGLFAVIVPNKLAFEHYEIFTR